MMKTTYFLLLILSIAAFHSKAATYTTLASGDWTNTTNVWSLDGVTPCGCAPNLTTSNDQIIINHDITASSNVVLNNGSSLTISTNGSFTSGNELTFNNSTATINGNVTVNKFNVNSGSVVDLNNALLTITARVEIYGTINIDGGYTLMTGGNVEVYPGGELNLDNGGKLDVQGGNITNSGLIDLCSTCCTTTSGNWRNNSNGTVTGSGAARSENGNMRNFGSWAITVAWCSSGTQQGMPGFENCFSADLTCNLVVLPVEFGEINASMNDQGNVEIKWNTVSERDNDYFTIYRLDFDKNWTEVTRISGAGSTTEAQYYAVIDYEASQGTNYYKIEQVDYNGEVNETEPVSVNVNRRNIHVYPNPAGKQNKIQITGVEKGANIKIITPNATVIWQEVSTTTSLEIDLNRYGFDTGMYLIEVIGTTSSETRKLIVL